MISFLSFLSFFPNDCFSCRKREKNYKEREEEEKDILFEDMSFNDEQDVNEHFSIISSFYCRKEIGGQV